ncbi:oligopeptide/dipeptide ABC transporter ATP-binding protein [Brevibacillus marinus]|uniref:oligopeptide/dipeptide ABC transporter ATP-binding protein n=1 Tax=Brevibacillus marinus TaxID=2496837 RepID=UPI001F49BEC6|nr:oligopeptide/dipeptide ABC transporter ATP-binding protein [Brevibacillus marinus]
MKNVFQFIDEHAGMYLDWLAEACNQPSVSAQNRGMAEMKELVKQYLEKIGAQVEEIPTNGYPIIYGELGTGKAKTLSTVKNISNRIAVMYLGKVVELAPKEELFRHTMHPYTHALISAVPVPDPTLREKKGRVILEGDVPDQTGIQRGCRFYARCPFGREKCEEETPLFREVRDGHFVSCHYPLH